jgi:phosphatidylethanolamine/phosphatidyl-N-methylethanolamine N-methyltransferase
LDNDNISDMDLNQFYLRHYRNSNESRIVKLNHEFSHKCIEIGVSGDYPIVLEVGAGNLEHFQFVKHDFDRYLLSDIRTIDQSLLTDPRQEFYQFDIRQIELPGESVDRLICTCVLHHVPNVKKALMEIRRVAKDRGLVTINIAADPGYMYRLMWGLTSGRRLKREGIQFPRSLHYEEHVSHYHAIKSHLMEIFVNDDIKFRYFPFRIPLVPINVFVVAQIKINKNSSDSERL